MMKDPLCVWLNMFDKDGLKEEPLVPLDIYTAASIGNCASISEALEVNADLLHVSNKGGWTALMYAAYYGHHEAVVLLLSRGASLHTKTPDGLTPLMLAASCGHTEAVKGLIKCGSILEARDNRSWTAIFHAVKSRHCPVLELLLKSGANAMACEPEKGETAIQAAIRTSDVDLVSLLLQYGANPTVPDHDGVTPYALASQLRYGTIADAIARAVATWGIVGSLTPRPSKPTNGECSKYVKDPDTSLKQLLTDAGLKDYLELFEQQAVDLLVFLSLTDADLKECGVSKLGPRRKMTALIARWHSGAPLRSSREAAYADKLSVELQELQLKNAQLAKDCKNILCKLRQEQELRSSTESLVVEARARLHKCHSCCTTAAQQLQQIYNTILTAADYCDHLACRGAWESMAVYKASELEGRDLREKTHIADGLRGMNAAVTEGRTTGLGDLHKSFDNEAPGIAVVKESHRVFKHESDVAEFCARSEKFVPTPDTVGENPSCRKLEKSSRANMSEYHLIHADGYRELHSQDPKKGTSNHSNVGSTRNFSNNVDNVSSFKSAINFYFEDQSFLGENNSSSREPRQNPNDRVREGVSSTEIVLIPEDYRTRPPSLCVPKLGGPVKECLELLKCSVTLSDPNIPRALTTTGLPASDQQQSGGSKVLGSNRNCSPQLPKMDATQQNKASKTYLEPPCLAVSPSSPATSSVLCPEVFSSGDSRFTSSNEQLSSPLTGDAARAATLAKLFQRTSISGTVQDA